MLSLYILIIFLLILLLFLLSSIDFPYNSVIFYTKIIQIGDKHIMNASFENVMAAQTKLNRHRCIGTSRNHFLFLLFTEGSGYLQHNKTIYDFHAYDCVLIHDMNELHLVPSRDSSCSFLEISFSQEHILYNTFQSSALTIIDAYLNSPTDLTLRSLDQKEYETVHNLASICQQQAQDTLPHAMILKQQIISTLIFYLARFYDISDQTKKQKNRNSASHTVMIEQIRQYIKQNYSVPLPLSALANFVYTNPSYLSRIFKAETGMALSAYINEVRISHAMQMLVGTDELIIDIAIACGYNYVPHFNKIFREVTGMTPTAYRKAYKKPSF